MFDYEFGDGTYLVAVTYGPDSMALLDMMLGHGVKPVVLYVDYDFDMQGTVYRNALSSYCEKNGLRLEAINAKDANQEGKEKDFEGWCRKVRYDFFERIYAKYEATALFLAHQQDDVIESYFLSKQNGIKQARYGRSRVTTYHGMVIVRPLLNYTHADLIEYCDQHNVPYSLDASLFERNHLRSAIRRDVVEKLNEVERGQILDEMTKKNSDQISFVKGVDASIREHDDLSIRALIALSPEEYATAVMDFVNRNAKKHVSISEKLLASLRSMCLNSKANDSLKIKDDIYFVKEYDRLALDNDGMNLPYCYVLEKPCAFSCPSFDLDFSMGAEDRNIHEDDYPITIRSVLPQDCYVYGGYLAPVKKMLLASGISQDYLEIWPVFLNKAGKIIYAPRFDKLFKEYHTSKLHIHPERKNG